MLPTLAWILTLSALVGLGAVFVVTARSAGTRGESSLASVRKPAGLTLAILGVPIMIVSLGYAPYRTEAAVPASTAVVDVVGHQWYWEISQTEVPTGEPVVFRVTSADVNHGFAIYDPDMRLIGQTQAMPGYVNGLQVRFEAPGVYRLLCLEYCGLVHHGMAAAITAVPPSELGR